MAFFKLPSKMKKFLRVIYVLTIVSLASADADFDSGESELTDHAMDVYTDEQTPLSMPIVNNSSEQDGILKTDENIRHQRQIRFKSSYQELPTSLKIPFQGNGVNTDTSDYSYFVQVDVDDPPPSTALATILPEGVKIYFPPQVSGVVAPVERASGLQNLEHVTENLQNTITQGKASTASPLSSSANLLTSSYSSLEDTDTFQSSTSKPVTTTEFSNLIGSQQTSFGQRNGATGLSSHTPKNLQNRNTAVIEKSSYLSYGQNDKPHNSLATQKRISTSRPPFQKTSTFSSTKNDVSTRKSFWRPLTSPPLPRPISSSPPPASFISHSQPTLAPASFFGTTITTTTIPSTRIPKTFSGSSTPIFLPTPSPTFSNIKQSFPKQQHTTAFPASSPNLHSNTKHQTTQTFSTPLPITPNSLQRKPTIKPQNSQSQSPFKFPVLSPSVSVTSSGTSGLQIPGAPVLPKSQTPHFKQPSSPQKQSSLSVGKFFNPGQNLVPATKPHNPFPKFDGKFLLSSSPNFFQANKESKRTDSGKLSQPPPRDGKTRTLVNSDNSNANTFPSSSGPDYPTLRTIPKTGFECASKDFGGYYADPETNCQVFHVCWGRRSASFLCPEGTLFNQQLLVCDWSYNVQCSSSIAASFREMENLFDNWGRNQV
ncbi:uncharacterized protein [Palaemon carinicauda]|uniref:uncharacterized protein n=1 Tax=Palaemon carinicauda TaxID=392227 RepID=UPI0035B5F1C1